MRATRIRAVLALALSAAFAIAGIVIVRQAARLAGDERRHAQDERSLEELRAALSRKQAQNPVTAAPPSHGASTPQRERAGASDTALVAGRDLEIERLGRELQDAHDVVMRLQSQLQSSDQERQKALAEANEDFQKREQAWRDRVAALQQQRDSAREEAQAARDRAASLLADDARIRSENGAGSARILTLRKTTASLQELNRRRDAYLNSIVRRYRDITDQFRAMAGELDSNRGSESSSFDGVALSRIQNAISLAEDDLRRVNELSGQSRQLESRLPKN